MKKSITAVLLVGALAGCAAPYATRDLEYSELACAPGIVESVHAVDLQADSQPFAAALELWMQPDLGDELVVRLDDGRVLKVVQTDAQHFEAGQRVRVVFDARGARVEHE